MIRARVLARCALNARELGRHGARGQPLTDEPSRCDGADGADNSQSRQHRTKTPSFIANHRWRRGAARRELPRADRKPAKGPDTGTDQCYQDRRHRHPVAYCAQHGALRHRRIDLRELLPAVVPPAQLDQSYNEQRESTDAQQHGANGGIAAFLQVN